MTFTPKEIEILVAGLDAIARQQKDVLLASAELLPIRQKLEQSKEESSCAVQVIATEP